MIPEQLTPTPPAAPDDPFSDWEPARNWLESPLYKHHLPGSMVKVYQDPMTENQLEGRAEVICHEPDYDHADSGFGWYLVCFKGESQSDSVHRLLKEPQQQKGTP